MFGEFISLLVEAYHDNPGVFYLIFILTIFIMIEDFLVDYFYMKRKCARCPYKKK